MGNTQLTFEALVNAYTADLYRYAYWLCKDSQLAQDLVQETFMRAWKALDKLENPHAAKAWLIRILRRELSRYLSKHGVEILPLEQVTDALDLAVHNSFDSVEAWSLQRALKALPQVYLEPLILQVIGGYSCEEIAGLLDLSPGAVMTRVCRARMQLRQALSAEESPTRQVKS